MNKPYFIYLVVKNKEGGEGGFKEREGFKKNLPSLEKWGGGGGGLIWEVGLNWTYGIRISWFTEKYNTGKLEKDLHF